MGSLKRKPSAGRCARGFLPSPMAISISEAPTPSTRIIQWPESSTEPFICALTTPIPLKEDIRYVDAIIEDIKWLGYDPGKHIYYGSDYSDAIYNAAVTLIKKAKAYVCDLTPEEVTEYRGTLTEPGRNSPYQRPVESRKI